MLNSDCFYYFQTICSLFHQDILFLINKQEGPSRLKQVICNLISLNSIYFQISIYTWQHTLIQIHGKWIGKQVT